MAITTTSVLPAPVQLSFSMKLLSVPVPNMIHKIPAVLKTMPAKGGKTLRMRRYNPLNTAMVPLGNTGVTPPAQVLTAVDIDAEMSFYGSYIQLNEQCTLQSQDPRVNGVSKSFLIDLEAYGECYGDRAEGSFFNEGLKEVHRERLSGKTRKGCDSLNSRGNLERESRRAFPA